MEHRYQKIRTYLQGWMNYFGIGMRYNDAVELDQWLRRRIRMCYWKQWRRTRKRVGELMKLGVGERPRSNRRTEQEELLASCKDRSHRMWVCPTHISQSRGLLQSEHCGSRFTIRLRPDDFREPPGADPHARWCGGWGRKSPGYPINRAYCFFFRREKSFLRSTEKPKAPGFKLIASTKRVFHVLFLVASGNFSSLSGYLAESSTQNVADASAILLIEPVWIKPADSSLSVFCSAMKPYSKFPLIFQMPLYQR